MNLSPPIAILSLACQFPEADGPEVFWHNLLDGRRAFRPIPKGRLDLSEYAAGAIGPADTIPPILAGLISDWSFPRETFRTPLIAFESTDLAHWLALDVAARAVAAVGGADALPRERCAVILGNTLTGEFSRSGQLRLRAPWLSRRLRQALAAQGEGEAEAAEILAAFAAAVVADFPEPSEESLAGALSNTIAGRIANQFDLHGGAWTVDAACAASLVAISDACGRLTEGSADAAIVGGVDLSLDPFELVGFARAGALALEEMRVFDRRAAGFWPGEGCGIAVLATRQAALRMNVEPLAWIRGWGVSTDGAGGLTRPTIHGQRLAVERAWRRAGLDPTCAGLIEAHGTGTAVGDPIEIRGLAAVLGPDARRIPVGSVKANIGHCKAAAGIAGLIKTTLAAREGVIPPHVGCEMPHPVFEETNHRLTPAQANIWEGERVAGLSGFGFGGVNAHVVLSAEPIRRPLRQPIQPPVQDAELFLFAADAPNTLAKRLGAMRERAPTLSLAQLADAAAASAVEADPRGRFRAAVVAARAEELVRGLNAALAALIDNPRPVEHPPRIGLLFPGQAAPVRASGGAWARRFPAVAALLARLPEDSKEGATATELAQPAIVAASAAAAALLARAGIEAVAACGHSLGELTALHWAGAIDAESCIALAERRGALMAAYGAAGGAMARIRIDANAAVHQAKTYGLEIACVNGPSETVLSGPLEGIKRLLVESRRGEAERLLVSHAFHSQDMASAVGPYAATLSEFALAPLSRKVISTVTGGLLSSHTDLRAALVQQLTAPVRFTEALNLLTTEVDLLIETGPGAGLTRLAREQGLAASSVDACADTLRDLLETLAIAWRLGASVDSHFLFADRPLRPFEHRRPNLLANPCGTREGETSIAGNLNSSVPVVSAKPLPVAAADDALSIVREIVAGELGLPMATVAPEARFLNDLHLNSLSVGRVVAAAAAALGLPPSAAARDLVNATVAELTAHLEELRALGQSLPAELEGEEHVEGVAPWVADYERRWLPTAWPEPAPEPVRWCVFGPVPQGFDHLIEVGAAAEAALVVLGPEEGDEFGVEAARVLWKRVKAARAARIPRLAIAHRGGALSGFARSLLEDGAFDSVTLIDHGCCPDNWNRLARLLAVPLPAFAEFRLVSGSVEVPALARSVAIMATQPMLGPGDLVLVTGGARGIGAECALRLGVAAGVSLVLAGRSAENEAEVAETLRRAAALGVEARYLQLDLADPAASHAALARLAAEVGAPTAVIHAAGVNRPAHFDDLNEVALEEILAPKLNGLNTLLATLEPSRLRLVVGFGSIIGRLGLAGETHYALANAFQSDWLVAWGRARGVRTLALDWSVWAGAGMGERLGAVERLRRRGVDAIPLNAALDQFERLTLHSKVVGARIVTGRFGPPPHVDFDAPPLPPLRFLDTPRVVFPGAEVVAEARLAPGSDPWLTDHALDGVPIVPGVMLLEAMAQTAVAARGKSSAPTVLTKVRFLKALMTRHKELTLRMAALVGEDGTVETTVQASDDSFAVQRASARMCFDPEPWSKAAPDVAASMWVSAEPLYKNLFFHQGRFRRIDALTHASAFSLRAELTPPPSISWFGCYESQHLKLGDPGARDAGLHVLQVCVPQRRVLPVGVETITLLNPLAPRRTVEAVEIASNVEEFVFDIVWKDAEGRAVEHWSGAQFRAIGPRWIGELPNALLPAALERAAALATGRSNLRVVIADGADRTSRRCTALEVLGLDVLRRGDGAPQVRDGGLSMSHDEGFTLVAHGADVMACDLVAAAPHAEAALTPKEQQLAAQLAESGEAGSAAAAVWAGRECLRKAGLPLGLMPKLECADGSGGWTLRAGPTRLICLPRAGGGCAALLVAAPSEVGVSVRSGAEKERAL